jgi:hypothetical protein
MSTAQPSKEDQGAARYFRKPTAADIEKGAPADCLVEGAFQGVSGYFDQPYYKDAGYVSKQEFAAAWGVEQSAADIFTEKSMGTFQNKNQAINDVKKHDKARREKDASTSADAIAQDMMENARKKASHFYLPLRKASPLDHEIPEGHVGTPNSNYGKPTPGPKEDMLPLADAAKKWGFDDDTFALIVKHGLGPYDHTDSRKAIIATAKAIAIDKLVENEQENPGFPAIFKIEVERDKAQQEALAGAAGKLAKKREATDTDATPQAPKA